MASVELRGLTKRYGDLAVVDNVSLTIEHGRLVCLLGPSGCGKTTTLRLIAGFVEPTAGEIRVGDRVVSSPARTMPPERRNMSMIFQSYALWPHMTVAENVAYGLELRKLDRDTIKRKLDGDPGDHAARRARRSLSRRALGRPAAARRAGARADRRARDAAARRAAVQSRRQSARGDALRGAPPARRVPLHHGLRHPRPVGGDDHRRRDRGDERRQDRAGRLARGHLRAAALGVRRPLHRLEQRHQGQGARRHPTSRSPASTLRCTGGKFVAGSAGAVSVRQHVIGLSAREAATRRRTWCRRTVVRQVFLGIEPRLPGRDAGRHPACAWSRRRPRTSRREPRSGCICRRNAAAC